MNVPKLICCWIAAVAALCAGLAQAQSGYPSKTIRLIISFPPGGVSDTVGRQLAQKLQDQMGQPVIVDNRPGGNFVVAANAAATAPADGHTIFMAVDSTMTLNPLQFAKLSYDPFKDFAPISLIAAQSLFIVASAKAPGKSLKELIAYARANPGKLNYGTGNTSSIVMTATFNTQSGVRTVHVPYKSEPQAVTDLLSGNVQFMFSSYTTIAPHVRDGRLRALVTTLPNRSPLMPEVPTLVEAGLPALPVKPWAGLVGPARMPREVAERLNREVNGVLRRAEIIEALNRQAFDARGSSVDEFVAYVREQYDIWGKAIRGAGIQPE